MTSQVNRLERPDPAALLWLDLETTGLDAERDNILEVALAIAPFRSPTRILERYTGVAHWSSDKLAHQTIHPAVLEMHAKSGLWAECERSDQRVYNLEAGILATLARADIPEPTDKEALPVLAGNSVHFDLRFIRCHMPALAKRLSHRVYDVSALSLFCRSLGMPALPKFEAHRAVADVDNSITQWRACADWLFLNPPIPGRY